MTCVGSCYLLFGGFDGKTTFGDLWWLVPEEDPIAKRSVAPPPRNIPENKDAVMGNYDLQPAVKESEIKESAVSELQKKLKISVSLSSPKFCIINELEDTEFLKIASQLVGEKVAGNEHASHSQAIEAVREHWRKSTLRSIKLKELSPLLRDYQRLIERHHIEKFGANLQSIGSNFPVKEAYQFYHVRKASQLRMDDIPKLLSEYQQILSH
ncbi:hypothetical protein NMG60_11008860 [Bertholletia excelsa]